MSKKKNKKEESGIKVFGKWMAYVLVYLMIITAFCVSVSELINYVNFRDGAVKIDSYVAEVEECIDGEGDKYYKIYVDFKYDGQLHQNVQVTTVDDKKKIEDKIKIYYNPKYPEKVETVAGYGPRSIYGIVISLILGLALTSVISSEIRASKKKKNKIYK